jgi:hypothetical protein
VRTDDAAKDRLGPAIALVASALMAAPLWVGRFLPLLDLPQHLALTTILIRHADPAWQLAAYFEPQPHELTPYWAHYLALEWLGRLMPVDTAARVFLTLYVVALPWAAMALARALGRDPRLGLLVIPLALNANLYYGFIAYCWSVVVLLWAMALLARQMTAPAAGRAVGLAVLTGVLFFAHVQSFAFLLLAAAVLAVCGDKPVGRRALRAWPLLPATLVLFLPWLYLSTTAHPGVDRYFPPLDDPRPKYETPLRRVANLPGAVAGSYQDGTDDWLLAAWAIAAGAAVASARRETEAAPITPVAALAGAALACYFVLPVSIQGQWNIAQRFAWTAALLAPLLARRSPRWVPAVTLVLAAATAGNAAWHHARFDREVDGFEGALNALPRGARVLGLIYDSRGTVMERWPYLHFEQYAIVDGGGYAAHSFAANAPLPVRLRPEARVKAPGVWRPDEFRYDEHGAFFDHFLVRDPKGTHDGARLFGGAAEEVFREGAWRVYRLRFQEVEP